MSNGFEFFEGTTSETTTPRITVRRGGLMVLTRGAVEMLSEDVKRVQLGYNAKTEEIGIRSAAENAKGSYLLRLQKNSPSCLIGGKRFFIHYGLSVDKARSFTVAEFGDGIVGFCLNDKTGEKA